MIHEAKYSYKMPETLGDDIAFNFANFLYENTGSIFGEWAGRMRVNDQRRLTGKNFAGKKRIYLNGDKERIVVTHQVCFGTDYDISVDECWANFERMTCHP